MWKKQKIRTVLAVPHRLYPIDELVQPYTPLERNYRESRTRK